MCERMIIMITNRRVTFADLISLAGSDGTLISVLIRSANALMAIAGFNHSTMRIYSL